MSQFAGRVGQNGTVYGCQCDKMSQWLIRKDDGMKFLIRVAVDVSTNTTSPASWDEEVVAVSKRAAARKFRAAHGLPKAEPLVISEVIPAVCRWDKMSQ